MQPSGVKLGQHSPELGQHSPVAGSDPGSGGGSGGGAGRGAGGRRGACAYCTVAVLKVMMDDERDLETKTQLDWQWNKGGRLFG